MPGFTFSLDDHSEEVLEAAQEQIEAALDAVGNQAVSHAKSTVAEESRIATGALRNSISHQVLMGEEAVYVGTNQEYAIYNEMGTGIYIGGGRTSPWSYQDHNGEWHRTRGMKPIHFIKNSIANHIEEYKAIIQQILRG